MLTVSLFAGLALQIDCAASFSAYPESPLNCQHTIRRPAPSGGLKVDGSTN